MGKLEWFDYLRMLNAVIALTACILSCKTAYRNWDHYTSRYRGLWWSLNAFLLLAVEGSIEQILSNVEWGPRNVLTLLACLVCLRAQLKREPNFTTD